MKLRYYLRGLGIGVTVTALILGISGGRTKPMSDAQIRARAAELGMVDGSATVLGNLSTESSAEETGETRENGTSQSASPTEGTGENGASQSASPTEETGENGASQSVSPTEGTGENGASQSVSPTEENGENGASQAALPGEDRDILEGTQNPQGSSTQLPTVETGDGERDSVVFTIPSGAGSGSISYSLQEAGLVEDASVFDAYLGDNGYSRRLRAGTFTIPVGAEMDEIARIITGG